MVCLKAIHDASIDNKKKKKSKYQISIKLKI